MGDDVARFFRAGAPENVYKKKERAQSAGPAGALGCPEKHICSRALAPCPPCSSGPGDILAFSLSSFPVGHFFVLEILFPAPQAGASAEAAGGRPC